MVLNSSPLFQILGLQDEAPALLEEPEEHFQPEAELTRIELCCPTINKGWEEANHERTAELMQIIPLPGNAPEQIPFT
ncbi:hypothetical protein AV530_014923 [Patagioenas fasciata monilis]|uniref:Uncharacterized protein n=1 Tax=Patagioenas fasciata monilis TaxID=372326 RepID=A0A1V4K0D6_PATFA|nr:hypothetical protein AV530_014923 [Patagioenas fasciata monilis]